MAKAKYTYNPQRKEWYTLVYDGTLTKTGAKHRKRITSKKSSADLEKKVIAFKQSLENQEVFCSNITFGEYSQQWLNTFKVTKEKNTMRMYKGILNTCFDSINDIPMLNLTHSNFQFCVNQKMDHPRTCQLMNLTFKQIIKSAARDHILPYSAIEELTTDISLPKYSKPHKRALTASEKKAFLMADLDERKRAFINILYYCGLRKGEVLALTTDDFDWNESTMSISKTIIFTGNTPELKDYPKSNNGIRSVPIPDACISSLKKYVDSCEGFLFKGKDKPIMTDSAYTRMWESIITSMNIALGYNPQAKKNRIERPIQGLTAHVFRHNYCTQLCYQIPTISTKMIAKLLGDDEKMVLEVYSHIQEEKENISSAINSAF